MHSSESATSAAPHDMTVRVRTRAAVRRFAWVRGGGIDGNEQLTAMVGVILIVLFAVIGLTILQIRQLIWLHLFLGLLLLGPVLLKLASTGYRLVRYYARDAIYRAKGPPLPVLRAMGPVLVLSTVAVFATGIWLLIVGPRQRSTPLLLHKVSFILWLVLMALHILAHLPELPRSLRGVRLGAQESGSVAQSPSGELGRWIALVGALVAGVVLAILLIPDFHIWTAPGAFPHHHHDG
jgi:hypothetical protein